MDTSVIMAVLMPDEEMDNRVLRIIKKVATGAYQVYCPVLVNYEIGNALVQAVKRDRLESNGLGVLWNNYGQIDKKIVENSWEMVFDLATKLGLTYYDAAFLEIALRYKAKLLTLDVRLEKVYAKYSKS